MNKTILSIDTMNFKSDSFYWQRFGQVDNTNTNVVFEFTVNEQLYYHALNRNHGEFYEMKQETMFHHMLPISGPKLRNRGNIEYPKYLTLSACSSPYGSSLKNDGFGVFIYNLMYGEVVCGPKICKVSEKYELITLMPWSVSDGKLIDVLFSIERNYHNDEMHGNSLLIYLQLCVMIVIGVFVVICFWIYFYYF